MVRFELSRTKSSRDVRQTRADDSIEIRRLYRPLNHRLVAVVVVSVVVVVVVVVVHLLPFDTRSKSSKTFRERVRPLPTFFAR